MSPASSKANWASSNNGNSTVRSTASLSWLKRRYQSSVLLSVCEGNHSHQLIASNGESDPISWRHPALTHICVPFLNGLTLIPAWISNYIHYETWDEITYPSPNFNGCTVEVWEWISNTLYQACDYLSLLGLKLIRVSERGPSWLLINFLGT